MDDYRISSVCCLVVCFIKVSHKSRYCFRSVLCHWYTIVPIGLRVNVESFYSVSRQFPIDLYCVGRIPPRILPSVGYLGRIPSVAELTLVLPFLLSRFVAKTPSRKGPWCALLQRLWLSSGFTDVVVPSVSLFPLVYPSVVQYFLE